MIIQLFFRTLEHHVRVLQRLSFRSALYIRHIFQCQFLVHLSGTTDVQPRVYDIGLHAERSLGLYATMFSKIRQTTNKCLCERRCHRSSLREHTASKIRNPVRSTITENSGVSCFPFSAWKNTNWAIAL